MGSFQAVNSILRHVASILGYKTNEELEALYQKTAWHFEAKTKKKGSSYDFFKQAVQDPSMLDECGLDENTKTTLLENIQQKLTQQAVKIRADIAVTCYTYEGKEGLMVTKITLKKKLMRNNKKWNQEFYKLNEGFSFMSFVGSSPSNSKLFEDKY